MNKEVNKDVLIQILQAENKNLRLMSVDMQDLIKLLEEKIKIRDEQIEMYKKNEEAYKEMRLIADELRRRQII